MVHGDTVRLLRECSSGITMGIDSIGDVMTSVNDAGLREQLSKSRERHRTLGLETDRLLDSYGDGEREPSVMAKGMSKLKSEFMLTVAGEKKDAAVADIITDGCNMGIKSLSRYLNEYTAADERSKDIAKRLISEEEELCRSVRRWL